VFTFIVKMAVLSEPCLDICFTLLFFRKGGGSFMRYVLSFNFGKSRLIVTKFDVNVMLLEVTPT